MSGDIQEKKRKRASEKHGRPNKKPAVEQPAQKIQVSFVENKNGLGPVIASTPGISLPQSVPLRAYVKSRSNAPARKSESGISQTEMLLQSSTHAKLDFVGREAEDEADAHLKHYAGIYDPKTGQLRIVEVRKMTVRGTVRSMNAQEEESETEEAPPMTNWEQRTALTNSFGTKQARKAAQSVAENALLSNAADGQPNAAENALLSSMPALDTKADPQAAVHAEIQAAKPIPKANLAAAHPSEVYAIEDLVPGGASTLRQMPIKEWQGAVDASAAIITKYRYVSRRVETVVKSGNTATLQLLRFMLVLLNLSRSLKAGGGKQNGPGSKRLPLREDLRQILSGSGVSASEESTPLNEPILESIRRKFAPNGSYLTKADITFLHTTIAALSLHIPPQPNHASSNTGGNAPNELATDPSDLRDDLLLDNPTITQYFRELGCRVDKPRETEFAKWGIKGGKAEAATKRIARLRLPVEFPKISRGGKK